MESVWGTAPESNAESYCKGAPMKMPTLLATANQKLSAFVRRRSFSERSRWLAVFRCGFAAFFYWLTECFSYHFRRETSLTHLLHAQAVPVRENRTRAGASLGFQRQRLWSLRGSSKGERIETLPLGESLLPFYSSRKEEPAPA